MFKFNEREYGLILYQLLTALTERFLPLNTVLIKPASHLSFIIPLPQKQCILVLFDAVLHSSVVSRQAPSGPPTSRDSEPQEDLWVLDASLQAEMEKEGYRQGEDFLLYLAH